MLPIIHCCLNHYRPIEEGKIISLIRARNQKGITQLYAQYADTIYGIIFRTVRDKASAEEVLQQTMLKAWNNFDSYSEKKGSLFTWLNTIARNTSIDTLRKKSFQVRQKTDSLDPVVHNVNTSTTDTSGIDVKNLVQNMEEKYRSVLEKVYLEGYSQSDASEELGVPLGTIKTRLRYAISYLREELKDEKNLFFSMLILLIIMLLQWL